MKVLDNSGQAAGVVVVSVGESYGVELANGAAPEIGRHNVLADVDSRSGVASIREHDAAIDEQQLGIGKADQQAVALPDINRRELEFAGVQRGWKRMPEDQGEERQDRGECDRGPATGAAHRVR